MKGKLNWQDPTVVNVFDELTLWSAPFGRMLLENVPMMAGWSVVDLGFGTGFPLIELSQRFGSGSRIYGVDIWSAGIQKTREKMKVFDSSNIKIFEQSASSIPLGDESVDLICSNLGVNNFEDREAVYRECFRILKPGGRLALTTNPQGTFTELFELFKDVIDEMGDTHLITRFDESVARRGSKNTVIRELESAGFSLNREVSDHTSFRFVNALALFDHSLIRFGFLESWENMVGPQLQDMFFSELRSRIQQRIDADGEFRMTVPMLYLEFSKEQIH